MTTRIWTRGMGLAACCLIAACSGATTTDADMGSAADATVAADGAAIDSGPAPGRDAQTRCTADVDCNDGAFCNGRETCAPRNATADAFGCVAGDAPCSATEMCDESNNECRTRCADADGDGARDMACGGTDCADDDASRYPGATEVCDADDEDCNPQTLGFVDADMDGAGSSACCNGMDCGLDCQDQNADVRPGAIDGPPDRCNNVDDDCDGAVDEGCPCVTGRTRDCSTTSASEMRVGRCRPGTQSCIDGMWQTACFNEIVPVSEICDGEDNNCNGMTDENVRGRYYRDRDGDGFGDAATMVDACSAPMGFVASSNDCDDMNNNRNPGATEVCNAVDDDCDQMVDEGVTVRVFTDADGDGYGDPATGTNACNASGNRVTNGTDCNDTSAQINPAAREICNGVDDNCDMSTDTGCACVDGTTRACGPTPPLAGICTRGTQRCIGGVWAECVGAVASRPETCNGLDDDCNGMVDDGQTASGCFADADADGYGAGLGLTLCRDAARPTQNFCPAGYVARGGDCADGDATVRPMAAEVCNGRDDDCDGTPDQTFTCPLGRSRAGTGAFGTCASVNGVFTCNGTCTAEVFTPSPPPETCDGADQNCNGIADDGFACVRSSMGPCTTACGLPGTFRCGTDCAVRGPGSTACTGAEVCNGCDDDGDGMRDQGLGAGGATICYQGQARSCTTACGTPGNQTCRSDCTGWDACRGTDVCNGCDDDLDGNVDDVGAPGRTCSAGTFSGCTTACGTTGSRTCNATCNGYTAACLAMGETCNYCDDNGLAGTNDEVALATAQTAQYFGGCPWLTTTSATCNTLPAGADNVDLTLTATTSDVGAWWRNGTWRNGYGIVRSTRNGGIGVFSIVQASRFGSAAPGGGWAIVIATDAPGATIGTAADLGVPMTRRGFSIEWQFTTSFSPLNEVDRIVIRELTGSGTGNVLGTAPLNVPNWSPNQLDSSSAASVIQGFYVEYIPDDPTTVNSEESIRVSNSEAQRLVLLTVMIAPASRIPPGSQVYIGMTAGFPTSATNRSAVQAIVEPFLTFAPFVLADGVCP